MLCSRLRGGRRSPRRVAVCVAPLVLLLAAPSAAQPGSPPPDRVPGARHAVEASLYLNQLTHPGGQVGYTFYALRSANGRHALVLGADVGAYLWPRHSLGVFVLPRVGYRGRTAGGFQGELNLHAGFLQGLLASESFDVIDGNVVPASRAGYPYFFLGPSVGIGWAIPRVNVTPFVRVGVQWQLPVFEQSLLRLVAAVGVEVALR